MPRYVDLDLLLEEIESKEPMNWTDSEAELQEQADYQMFKNLIENAPTADVVPRSEVERLTIELEAMRGAANSYKMHYEQAQAEKDNLIATYEACMRTYAEQLFEEIEELMIDGAIGNKYPAKVINPDKYAELKKKHLGDKK